MDVPSRASDLMPLLSRPREKPETEKDNPKIEDPKRYLRGGPDDGEAHVELYLVVPKNAPQQIDEDDPEFEGKLDMVREGSLTWVEVEGDHILRMAATSKPRLQGAIDGAINLFSKEDVGIMGDQAFHLVQVPAAISKSFQVRYEPVCPAAQLASAPQERRTWRAITDPFPSTAVDKDEDMGPSYFAEYVETFKDYFADVASRLHSIPDEIRMRIHLGTLEMTQFQETPDYKRYQAMLEKLMLRKTYTFNKSMGHISLARKIRQGIEASPTEFMPASHRIENLEDTAMDNFVVIIAKHLRIEIQVQDIGFRAIGGSKNASSANRAYQHMVRPTIFKNEGLNREVAVVSANPGGSYDWDLEILVEQPPERVTSEVRHMNKFVSIDLQKDGTMRPVISQRLAQTAGITEVFVKQARRYIIVGDSVAADPFEVEVAVFTQWDTGCTTITSQACTMALCAMGWQDQLNRRNIAVEPRDFGPNFSNLLCPEAGAGAGQDESGSSGAARLLRFVTKMQKFMDRVKAGYFEPPPPQQPEVKSDGAAAAVAGAPGVDAPGLDGAVGDAVSGVAAEMEELLKQNQAPGNEESLLPGIE